MRIALIDNGSRLQEQLADLLAPHEVSEYSYPEAGMVLEGGFDAIILSGSSLPSIVPITTHPDVVRAEIQLIQETTVPLLGICYGFELIAFSFNGVLSELPEPAHGMRTVHVDEIDPLTSGLPATFEAYEYHRWVVKTPPPDFIALAHSDTGVEILRHTTRPLLGFQFHPEKMTSEPALQVFRSFLALAEKK